MFEIKNERSGDSRYSGINEANHVFNVLIELTQGQKEPSTLATSIRKTITKSTSNSVILFDINENSTWCRVEEFPYIKFACEQATSSLLVWYVAGSLSSMIGNSSNVSTSTLDGYQLRIKFD